MAGHAISKMDPAGPNGPDGTRDGTGRSRRDPEQGPNGPSTGADGTPNIMPNITPPLPAGPFGAFRGPVGPGGTRQDPTEPGRT